MKGKTLLSLAIVISMMLAVLPLVAVKASPTTVEVRFENGTNESPNYAPCTYFTVEIWITDTPDITQYIIEFTWDTAVLELATGTDTDVHKGTFLAGDVFLVTISGAGLIEEVTEAKLAGTKSGSGLLFTIDFHCKAIGDTTIAFVRSVLLNGLVLVPCDPINGIVHQPPPPATPPIAKIAEPLQGAMIEVCTNVTLDGSTSTDGYDTLPDPGHSCPITEWKWELDFGNDGSIDLTLYGEITEFHCDGPGVVKINLTVTAPDLTPPTAPDYVDHSSKVITIMQVMPSLGPAIDVFTDRGGEGPLGDYPFGWSDAYGPQEEVCVYAKVTYNDEPVEYKPVGFEMIRPDGTSVDYRVAFTNASGIAKVCFRIPWEGHDAELLFGNWSIVGTVDVAGTIVTDTVKFRFGYIIDIVGITVTPDTLYKLDTMTIDVDLQSISMIGYNVFLTMVACDECGVPIGVATDAFTVAPEDGMSLGNTITIPSWAFVGLGTIYVNVFTAPPSAGGVPYCPEDTALFTILKTP